MSARSFRSAFLAGLLVGTLMLPLLGGGLPESGAIALRLQSAVGSDGMPSPKDWARATPISFDSDWQGKNADPERRTEVRILWTPDALYLRFVCRYRSIHVFDDAEPSGRRDKLWERDVAEVFLQSDQFGTKHYKEFEVSPNGQWVDLEITPEGGSLLSNELRRVVSTDTAKKEWTAVIAIPMKTLIANFDPKQKWRVNFFRCEGVDPERSYLAWRRNDSPQPNFHVPAAFGALRFTTE
jgi:alpha-galactosidase